MAVSSPIALRPPGACLSSLHRVVFLLRGLALLLLSYRPSLPPAYFPLFPLALSSRSLRLPEGRLALCQQRWKEFS